jgi:uncharacterized membrane protein
LYIGGGGWASFLTTVEGYDTSLGIGGTWQFTNSLNQGRRTFAYATDTINGHLYAAAGWAGAYLNNAEKSDFDVFGDVPWLSQQPVSGTVPATGAVVVEVTFNAGLPITQTGEYYATMLIMNDSSSGTLMVPVTMTVEAIGYGVTVGTDDADLSGVPGTPVVYTVWVTNTGDVQDTFDLSISDNTWPTVSSSASVTLDAGASAAVLVTVDIPAGAGDGDMDTATFTATSQADATATDSVDLTTTAVTTPNVYGVEMAAEDAALSGVPGTSVVYTVWITNTGNVQDTFDLAVSGNAWPTVPASASVTLDAGASAAVLVTVNIPAGAADGATDTAVFTATSQVDASATDLVALTTTAEWMRIYLPIILKP